ncbi:YfiR family protein [Sphaerotilus microaerophilus]|uniref:YfiR family protein n=1 Tax=Sphaerotilus microaerophilus TaxID=2914710 RepID=A0ABN6PJE8_9BURK|nr:YfiR family protein [Sphaerotilus sp. FB-5]BDI03903.1 hypothetical protein CATMQ487_08730 [Sphaerotilus sp. FB-5]
MTLHARQKPGGGSPRVLRILAAVTVLLAGANALAQEVPEYRLKAAFLYNFALYTEWPTEVGNTLQLCLAGADPFGREIDGLQGRPVGQRSLAVSRRAQGEAWTGCQIVFVTAPGTTQAIRALDAARGQPMLTVADTPGALRHGVMLNMNLAGGKVSFEAHQGAARAARLTLSARLLRLATEVLP